MVQLLDSRQDFTLQSYRRVTWQGEAVSFGPTAKRRLAQSRAAFLRLLDSDEAIVIYGVTSGYGQMAHLRFDKAERKAQLKAQAANDPGTAEVRRRIQQAELAAERETLLRLQHLALRTMPLEALSSPIPNLENSLASRWKLQKKEQLLAVQTLECQLDPL